MSGNQKFQVVQLVDSVVYTHILLSYYIVELVVFYTAICTLNQLLVTNTLILGKSCMM